MSAYHWLVAQGLWPGAVNAVEYTVIPMLVAAPFLKRAYARLRVFAARLIAMHQRRTRALEAGADALTAHAAALSGHQPIVRAAMRLRDCKGYMPADVHAVIDAVNEAGL